MMAEVGIALVKLLLGLAVFAVLGYVGRFYDKRIAGVLLTFPILNGIGILTGADPLAVADSIYAVVVFNGLLLFLMVSFSHAVPPLPAGLSLNKKLVARLAAWTAIWAIGAPLVTFYRDALPGVLGLFLIQLGMTAVAVSLCWKPANPHARLNPPRARQGHLHTMMTLWLNRDGLLRLGLFALCCVILFVAAQLYDSKWVGMLSALPLPGLFAVATLSVMESKESFDLLRDSVPFGPITVIAFNWLCAQAVVQLPAGALAHTAGGFAVLTLLLSANAMLFFWIVPKISVYLDRIYSQRRTGP
jgi:hypothetical protein